MSYILTLFINFLKINIFKIELNGFKSKFSKEIKTILLKILISSVKKISNNIKCFFYIKK